MLFRSVSGFLPLPEGAFSILPMTAAALMLTAACTPTAMTSARTAQAAVKSIPSGAPGSSALLQFDFNGRNPCPGMSGGTVKTVGTIDVAKSTIASGALLSTAGGALTSGLLPVRASETNLGKLTLSFDHSVSLVRPVTVRIESFDARKKRTGGREGVVYPAAPDFYQRAALELSTMKAFGGGSFKPTDPFVRITFGIAGGDAELRIDNVAYAAPAYYVSPGGKDTNDGRTEKTAFATPQKAVDSSQPGDIILVMNGTYAPGSDPQKGVAFFQRAGAPAAWITLKNYPGHKPVLSNVGAWNAIRIGNRGTKEAPSPLPALAYLEVRGLHIRGNADTVKETNPELIDQSHPLTNGNGISVEHRFETSAPHHIRVADNVIEYCSGAGFAGSGADWLTVENNIVRNNCWWMIYGGSGISFLDSANFDGASNVYKSLIRNNVASGNRTFVKWRQVNKISDGNGIIIDTNYVPAKNQVYLGRTLVQNNLSVGNGGSGIHTFRSHQVDIVNNTAYYNGASPELNWGQIFVQITDDITIRNNILVSRPNQPINSVGPNGGDQNSTNIVRSHNIYFGGLPPKLTGENDLVADPQFVNPATDARVADFRLRPGSPARKSGWRGAIVPWRDIDGRPRPTNVAPDRGAYQHEP